MAKAVTIDGFNDGHYGWLIYVYFQEKKGEQLHPPCKSFHFSGGTLKNTEAARAKAVKRATDFCKRFGMKYKLTKRLKEPIPRPTGRR